MNGSADSGNELVADISRKSEFTPFDEAPKTMQMINSFVRGYFQRRWKAPEGLYLFRPPHPRPIFMRLEGFGRGTAKSFWGGMRNWAYLCGAKETVLVMDQRNPETGEGVIMVLLETMKASYAVLNGIFKDGNGDFTLAMPIMTVLPRKEAKKSWPSVLGYRIR
jgi:hypothetical protein